MSEVQADVANPEANGAMPLAGTRVLEFSGLGPTPFGAYARRQKGHVSVMGLPLKGVRQCHTAVWHWVVKQTTGPIGPRANA